jgi:hypothetical protein
MMAWRGARWLVGLVLFLPNPSGAQQIALGPDSGVAGYRGVDSLLLMESVQKELRLNPEQLQRVKEIAREARQQKRGDFDRLVRQNLTQDERRNHVLELMRQVSRDTSERVREVLKPEQFQRLRQIELQEMGLRAFSDPEVVRSLRLTEEQRQRLNTAAEETAEQMRKLFKEGPRGSYLEGLKGLQARGQQAVERALAVLTAEQRATWQRLVGEPFESSVDRPNRVPGGEKRPNTPPPSVRVPDRGSA